MSRKETAAAIRHTLKADHGWTSRQISVRDGGGTSQAVYVTIKDASVDRDVVEAVAAGYRRQTNDIATGQALKYGIHTHVFVEWDSKLVQSIAGRIDLDAVRALPAGGELTIGIVGVRRLGGEYFELSMLDKVAAEVVDAKLGRFGEVCGVEAVACVIAHASLALDGREIDRETAPSTAADELVDVYVREGAPIERVDTETGTSTTIAAPAHGVDLPAVLQADGSHRHDGGRYVYIVAKGPQVSIARRSGLVHPYTYTVEVDGDVRYIGHHRLIAIRTAEEWNAAQARQAVALMDAAC